MTQHTNTSVLTAHGIPTDALELPDMEIPIISGNQRQGDVLVLKVTTTHAGKPLGKKGVTVVRAETNTANTHTLHGDGTWAPNARAAEDLVQGWLTVKVLLLVVYVALGSLALRRARARAAQVGCFFAALGVFLLIASVARAHHPLGIVYTVTHLAFQPVSP